MGDLVTVQVLDRSVTFRQFNDVQLVLIHRVRQILNGAVAQLPDDVDEASESAKRAMDTGMGAVSQFLTMLEGLVVDELDRQWLAEQMLIGSLDLGEIAKFVQTMIPADKQPKAPAKKAVRAR